VKEEQGASLHARSDPAKEDEPMRRLRLPGVFFGLLLAQPQAFAGFIPLASSSGSGASTTANVLQLVGASATPRVALDVALELRLDETPFLGLSNGQGRSRANLPIGADEWPALRLFDEWVEATLMHE
jgi:hypothetical protein